MGWWNGALTPGCGALRAPADGSIVSITVCSSPGMLVYSTAALVTAGALVEVTVASPPRKGYVAFFRRAVATSVATSSDFAAAFC